MAIAEIEKYFLQKNIPYIRPFYTVDHENEDDLLTWIKDTDSKLSESYNSLFREQKSNLQIFLNAGINPNFFSPLVSAYLHQGLDGNEEANVSINEMYLLVMEQVSTIVSNELTSQVLPNNDDYKDKIASKFVKQWLDSMSYDLDLDIQRIKWEIQKKVFGECFVIPRWDPEAGDLHPIVKDFDDEEIPMLDENGKKIKDDNGDVVNVNKFQRVGDIELVNPLPFHVMIDPKESYKDSNWFYYIEYKETDYLQRKFEGFNFKGSKKSEKYDPNSGFDKTSDNLTKVYHFYHKAHEFVPEGRYVMCTKDEILINQSLRDNKTLIDSKELPLVRFADLDIGIGVRGSPMLFRNTKNVVAGYNRVTNQMMNNVEIESPKLVVHESAGLDGRRMPDGVCVLEWRGNIKPTFETPTSNTNSIFKFREDLKKNIMELGGQTPMVRGDTPNAQLDSFIALQHFEDQRVQLAGPDIKNHIKSIEHLYRFMIVIAKDHYDESDERLIKIVGKNNKYNLKYFDPENLNKVYDVKLTTTGNLANSKAARTQLILTIKREFPEMMSNEIFVDMLGLSSSEKFQNSLTAAVNSAESENEDILNGEQVTSPERFEDLLTHWDIHRMPMQSREYKVAPPEIQMLFERHITATEKLMYDQAAESDSFAERLSGLRQFPMFFSPVPNNAPPPEEEGLVEEEQPPPQSIEEPDIENQLSDEL